MATVTIKIDIDANGNVTLDPNPAVVGDGDTVRWHVNSNAHKDGRLDVILPPGANSPFGNTDVILQEGVEEPRRCNLMEPAPEPLNWPPGVDSYTYNVEFSSSPVVSAALGTLLKREAIWIGYPDFPDDVLKVYLVPQNPPINRRGKLKCYQKIYPIRWWKRCCHRLFRHHEKCCCCCCCCAGGQPAPPAVVQPKDVVGPPTIDLRQGMLAIGGLFYLLITPRGDRCQFVVEWTATGGVGQLTVDLDVQDPGSTTFRRLATGLGPNDQFVFVGARATYLFRATVTDSRGQSTFDTLSVTCP